MGLVDFRIEFDFRFGFKFGVSELQFAFKIGNLLLERNKIGLHIVHAFAWRYLGSFRGHEVL